MPEGTSVIDPGNKRYLKLYSGDKSIIYKALDENGMSVTIKKYYKQKLCDYDKVHITNEIDILFSLNHRNIIKGILHNEDVRYIYIYQEFAERGDLFDFVSRFANRRLPLVCVMNKIVYQILQGLQYLHNLYIIHRDIKPENILITGEFIIKICDFGLSINQKTIKPMSKVGTLEFMAPEIIDINKNLNKVTYNEKVDIWALGCLTYELLYGISPFYDINNIKTEYRICNTKPSYNYNVDINQFTLKFINNTLITNPNLRPSASDLLTDYSISNIICDYTNPISMLKRITLPRNSYTTSNIRTVIIDNETRVPSPPTSACCCLT